MYYDYDTDYDTPSATNTTNILTRIVVSTRESQSISLQSKPLDHQWYKSIVHIDQQFATNTTYLLRLCQKRLFAHASSDIYAYNTLY